MRSANHLARGASPRGRAVRRRLAAVVLGALGAAALMGAPASAAVPTFETSFDGSTITPAPTNPFRPEEIAVDQSTGDVWVIDSGNNVVYRFSSAGVWEATVDGTDTAARRFTFGGIDGLAVDGQGNVYVASEVPTVLYAFGADGGFLWESTDNLNDLCGVTVDPAGTLWTSDYYNGVQQRDPTDGAATGSAFLAGNNGCALAFDSRENLYVSLYNASVNRYDPPAYAAPGTTAEGYATGAIVVDPDTDALYTARNGGGIGMWAASGAEESGSPFGVPTKYGGLAVDSGNGLLYATDPAGGEVEVFRLPPPRTLRVLLAGTGSGSVTSDPAGIDCGSTCESEFPDGTTVTLTGLPTNATLTWSGGGCTGGDPCQITLTADTTVTATFTQNAPTVAGEATSNVTDRGATLRGTVNPRGVATTCEFQYGPTTGYGSSVASSPAGGSGSTPVAVSATLSGLSAGTTYHYRLACRNSGGTTNGGNRTFRTSAPPAPVATTGAASGVTQTAASLAGTVNPSGYATTCYFEYGTTTAYGSRVDCASAPGSGTSAVEVSAALSGLTAGTTYHFRLVAVSAGGTVNGNDGTFTTAAAPSCATDRSLCPPPPPPGLPTLELDSSTASVARGKASVKLSCEGAGTCSGRVQLTARVRVRGRRGRRARSRTVVVGSAKVNIAAGRSSTVRISLSRVARKALARTGRLRVAIAGPGGLDARLTLRQPARRGRRGRGRRARRGRR